MRCASFGDNRRADGEMPTEPDVERGDSPGDADGGEAGRCGESCLQKTIAGTQFFHYGDDDSPRDTPDPWWLGEESSSVDATSLQTCMSQI